METPCEECKRLKEKQANAYKDWCQQRAANQTYGEKGKAAKKGLDDLYFEYELAGAELHGHVAGDHPETGRHTSAKDVDITAEAVRRKKR